MRAKGMKERRRTPRKWIVKKEQIDAIFQNEAYTHQSEVAEALYRMAFPAWDNITAIYPWPQCGKELGLYVMGKFMEFDRKHHPDVMNGGLWMNKGWSGNDRLEPWELDVSICRVELATSEKKVS